MTREEFGKGWLLLVAQSWGGQYADNSPRTLTQQEFYFAHASNLEPQGWLYVCSEWARWGGKWPRVIDLQNTYERKWWGERRRVALARTAIKAII